MPDLSPEACAKYWFDYNDPMIYRVVMFMEGVENWTYDHQAKLESTLSEMGKSLDEIGKIDMDKLGHEQAFIEISNHLKTTRGLRLLQAIDTAHPGAASKLLIHAEDTSKSHDDPPGLFLRRNIVFERLRLLSRVFSHDRFAMVLKTLEGEEDEDSI